MQILYSGWNRKKVLAGYTTDFDGLFHYCRREDVSHYQAIGNSFGINADHMIRVHQYHTDHVLSVNEENGGDGILHKGSEEGFDAMVTDASGLMLCIITADCVPVFFYDERRRAIGLAHSGRMGTAKEIAFLAMQKMQHLYGCNPEDIHCALGPYLCAEHHELDKEDLLPYSERFSFPEQEKFIKISGERAYVDMGAAIQISLARARLQMNHFYNCGICTYEQPQLFSWRRDHNPDAHILSFIMLEQGN